MKMKRNDLCYCGSGQKYKKCHMNLDAGWHYDAKANNWYKPTPADEKKAEVEKIILSDEPGASPTGEQPVTLPVANMGSK